MRKTDTPVNVTFVPVARACMSEPVFVPRTGKTLYHLISFRNQILGSDQAIRENGQERSMDHLATPKA
jgi:hypothetical protein